MALYFINLIIVFIIVLLIALHRSFIDWGVIDVAEVIYTSIIALPISLALALLSTMIVQENIDTLYMKSVKYTYHEENVSIHALNGTMGISGEMQSSRFFIYAQVENHKKYTVYVDNNKGGVKEKTYVGNEVDIFPTKEDEQPYIIIEKKTAHKPEYFKYYKYLSNNHKHMDFSEYDEVTILEIHVPQESFPTNYNIN